MRIVGGVDCHKASHVAVFLDSAGRFIEQLAFAANADGYERALSRAQALGCTEWGLEGTGSYGYGLAVYASSKGAVVYEVPGAFTKRHRRHGSRRGKSDGVDARAIAEVVLREPGRLPRFHLAVRQRALRLRYDQRDRLVRERTKAANRLRNAAVQLGVTDLPKTLTATKNARWIAQRVEGFRRHTALHEATEAILDELREAADEIVRLNERIRRVLRHLRPLVRATAKELLELRGVSEVVAAGLIGHAGDMRNLRDAAAFAMKAGVAPVPCSSGQSRAVRVNQGGDRQLNRLLHIIAITQIRCETHAGSLYYRRKRGEGKTHRSALRCLKRQLATVVYYRLRAAQMRQGAADSTPLPSAKAA
jgi:transposase